MAFSALRSLSHRMSVNSSSWFVLSLFFQPMHLNSKFLQQKVRLKWTFFLSDKQKNKSDIRATLLLLSFVNIKCFAKFSFSIWKKHLIWNRVWISCELFSALEVYLGNTPRLVLVNIPVPAQRRTFKSLSNITFFCKQALKLEETY